MNEQSHANDDLDGSHVASNMWRLLAAAHRAGSDPISDLCAHLSNPALAATVIDDAMTASESPLSGFGDAQHHLTTKSGLELLRAMKQRAKRDLGPEQADPAKRRAGLFAFGMVVSACLVQHRILDTRASRESIEDLLLILCAAEPAWIVSLASQALIELAELDGNVRARIA